MNLLRIIKISISLGTLILIPQAKASTFVGNGGSTTDIEMTIANKQLRESLEIIDQTKNDPNNTFCSCPKELEGHPLCATLQKLSEPQRAFCKKSLSENAMILFSLFDQARIQWTNESIAVNETMGLRAAHAVTDPNQKIITLDQQAFKNQKPYERIFILTHELGHLAKWDGRYLKDDEAIGPFNSFEGGREFLNAVGAAVAINAYEYGLIYKYDPSLNRSQSRKTNFLSWLGEGVQMNSDDSFAVKRLAGSSFRYSYFHDSDVWGLWVMTSSHSGDDKILTQTQIKHERRNFSIGVARRFFFPADPLTYFGQSFVNLSLGIESSYHTYSANDGFLISEAKDTSTQAIADLAYSLPIINNFWLELALGYRADQFTLKIDNRNIPYRSSTYSKLGVAYAF